MTTALFTEDQQDLNWQNLSREQRSYFNHLADDDPVRTGQAFFEDTVPPELQDKPELLEVFLNGGEVDGTIYPDRDWSHDVSRANGGSDSADNGRWEEASVNRSRGARNSTADEQAAADASAEADSETLLESAQDITEAGAWGVAADIAGGFVEASLDGLLPLAASAVAAKKVSDNFDSTRDRVGWGAAAAGLTALYFASPLGAPTIAGYVTVKVAQKGIDIIKKHTK